MNLKQWSWCSTTRVKSRVWLFALVGACAALESGCYHGVPIALEQVKANEQVDVLVTDAAATRLTKELGVYTARLQGPVRSERGDSVSVSVLIAREFSGVALESARLDLFLARSEVTGVRRRQLSRTRTTFASIGAVVLFGVVVGTVTQLGDPNKPPHDELPPPPPVGSRFGLRFSFR
jgi:hypothetical protein